MRELLAYSQGAVIEEKLTLRIRADNNGDIYLPVAGYSSDGIQECDYDWMVSIDGNNEVEYSGLGSSNGKIRVGYGLSPLSVHTVIIKPKEEDFGWLRAFGYKGTDIASSLINIISDKSYKGYAVSEIFTGNYYKAYQYYLCSNLINTDEELLPDTLEVIGNNYRYYEYAGCNNLVHNAEEKILKTVKVIGDNYRAYQYQNCVGIKRIDMRAINWASVGSNYRLNQFEGMGNDRGPVEIYIEGGIEEGGSWGLVNNNVKGVYVYKDLVSDYQTKLSTITSSKIKKNDEWDNFEYEFIEYIGIADNSGEIRIPVGGYSTSGSQNCAYDWMVSIDGEEAVEITGTGSATYVSVGSGLTEGSEHRIVIKPKTISWGWGRAFGFHNTGAQAYIKEIIHDSYKCYAVSRTDTGAHYKHGTFMGCVNLINSYEKLPTSVTSIGADYMSECYGGCIGLITAFYEILHKDCTIGSNYRYHQYTGCTSLSIHQGIAGYMGETYPTNYKYEYLSGAGDDLVVYITRYEALASGLTNSLGLADNKVSELRCFVDDIARYRLNNLWSTFTSSIKWKAYYYGYVCGETIDITTLEKEWEKTLISTISYDYIISLGACGVMMLPGDIVNLSFQRTSKSGYARRPGLIIQKLSDVGVVGTSNYQTFMSGSTYWTGRGVKRMGNTKKFWYSTDREDYYNYAYGVVDAFNGDINGGMGGFTPNCIPEQNHNGVDAGLGVSANGQYVWCRVEGQTIQSIFLTPYSGGYPNNFSRKDNIIGWNSLEFSDDGMTMYVEKGGEIEQYSLSSPRFMESAVSTGKKLTGYSGGYFSFYKGSMYTNSGTTIYKYSKQ